MDNPFTNPRILSYCPGFLGLERGIKRAIGAIRTVAYVEIEAFICENLLAGMEAGILDAAPIWANLKTFDPKPFRGAVDSIIGGYPCQPFSNAGRRAGEEDPRHLYPYLEQHIRTIQPVWCFFENVAGHLSIGFAEVCESLRNMGFAVEAGIFTAEEVGAPHQRERVFILAILHSAKSRLQICGYGEQQELFKGSKSNRPRFHAFDKSTKGSCDKLDNPNCKPSRHYGKRIHPETPPTAIKLGNAKMQLQQIRIREKEAQISYRRYGSHQMAYSNNSRCKEQRERIPTEQKQPATKYNGADRWPARPGQEQYEWESPRVKPGMDSTINGYNFREDLLRAYGNSVVEQTAELAFKTLLNKHIKNKK